MSDEMATYRKAFGCIGALLSLCGSLPGWLYLLHYILVAVEASSFVWAIYWAYVPVSVLGAIFTVLSKGD